MSVRTLMLAILLAGTHAHAGRGVTLQVLVDGTMFGSTPGAQAQVRGAVLQAVTRLVPGVDSVRVGVLCGAPVTVYEAMVARDLSGVAAVMDIQALRPCTVRGSRLTAGLRWAATRPGAALLLVTDAAFSDDPERASLSAVAAAFAGPLAVIGARATDRDALAEKFRAARGFVGVSGVADAGETLRLLLRRLRR